MNSSLSTLKLLAEFEFQNHDFKLLQEAKDEVYVQIDRECRRTPFPNMKQPTPRGGILGMEAVLVIKHRGLPGIFEWELFHNDNHIQSGQTNDKGISGALNIPLSYGSLSDFKIKVFSVD